MSAPDDRYQMPHAGPDDVAVELQRRIGAAGALRLYLLWDVPLDVADDAFIAVVHAFTFLASTPQHA